MNDVNRSPVRVDLKDVQGHTITDRVKSNSKMSAHGSSASGSWWTLLGQPVGLPGVPAFPFAEVFINPTFCSPRILPCAISF